MDESEKARGRQIGTIGTVARLLIGFLMVLFGLTGGRIEVMHGNVQTGFDALSVAIGLVAFPAVLLSPIDGYEGRLKSKHSERQ